MSSRHNKSISSSFLEKLWNDKDLQVIDELLSDEYVDHTEPPYSGTAELQDKSLLKDVVTRIQDKFFSIHVTIEDQVAEGDKVVTRVVWECTFKDNSNPPNPTQAASIRNIGIDRIEHGRIVENWNTLDVLYRLISLFDLGDPFLGPDVPDPGDPPCKSTDRNPCKFGRVCRDGRCVHG